MVIKKNNIIFLPLLFFSFFPYMTPISFGSDIQPWCILYVVFIAILMIVKKYKIRKEFIFLFIPFFVSLFFLIGFSDLKLGARSVLGYLSICLIPYVYYHLLQNNLNLFVKFLKISTIIYFIIAIIQFLFNKHFLVFLINRISTSDNRGVTSLTPEPTFYGLICVMLILIFLVLRIEDKKKYIYLLTFQIIFLSQSITANLYLILLGLIFLFFQPNFKLFLLFFLVIISTTYAFLNYFYFFENWRVIEILSKYYINKLSITETDQSINYRFSEIYFSIKGFIDNNFLPNGFDSYADYIKSEIFNESYFQTNKSYSFNKGNRISSFYGSLIFEMGIIGALIPVIYTLILVQAYKKKLFQFLIYFTFIHLLLFSSLPLTFPFVGILFAVLLFNSSTDNFDKKNIQ